MQAAVYFAVAAHAVPVDPAPPNCTAVLADTAFKGDWTSSWVLPNGTAGECCNRSAFPSINYAWTFDPKPLPPPAGVFCENAVGFAKDVKWVGKSYYTMHIPASLKPEWCCSASREETQGHYFSFTLVDGKPGAALCNFYREVNGTEPAIGGFSGQGWNQPAAPNVCTVVEKVTSTITAIGSISGNKPNYSSSVTAN